MAAAATKKKHITGAKQQLQQHCIGGSDNTKLTYEQTHFLDLFSFRLECSRFRNWGFSNCYVRETGKSRNKLLVTLKHDVIVTDACESITPTGRLATKSADTDYTQNYTKSIIVIVMICFMFHLLVNVSADSKFSTE